MEKEEKNGKKKRTERRKERKEEKRAIHILLVVVHFFYDLINIMFIHSDLPDIYICKKGTVRTLLAVFSYICVWIT